MIKPAAFCLPLLLLAACATDPSKPVRYDMESCLASLRAGMPGQTDIAFDPSTLTHRGGDWTIVSEAKGANGWRQAWVCNFKDGVFESAQWIKSE